MYGYKAVTASGEGQGWYKIRCLLRWEEVEKAFHVGFCEHGGHRGLEDILYALSELRRRLVGGGGCWRNFSTLGFELAQRDKHSSWDRARTFMNEI